MEGDAECSVPLAPRLSPGLSHGGTEGADGEDIVAERVSSGAQLPRHHRQKIALPAKGPFGHGWQVRVGQRLLSECRVPLAAAKLPFYRVFFFK